VLVFYCIFYNDLYFSLWLMHIFPSNYVQIDLCPSGKATIPETSVPSV